MDNVELAIDMSRYSFLFLHIFYIITCPLSNGTPITPTFPLQERTPNFAKIVRALTSVFILYIFVRPRLERLFGVVYDDTIRAALTQRLI